MDSHNQQLRVYTNTLEFTAAVNDGVDSYFSFNKDPGMEMGVSEDGCIVVFEDLTTLTADAGQRSAINTVRSHPSPEYDFADEEKLPSPFLKRGDKAAGAAALSNSN